MCGHCTLGTVPSSLIASYRFPELLCLPPGERGLCGPQSSGLLKDANIFWKESPQHT